VVPYVQGSEAINLKCDITVLVPTSE